MQFPFANMRWLQHSIFFHSDYPKCPNWYRLHHKSTHHILEMMHGSNQQNMLSRQNKRKWHFWSVWERACSGWHIFPSKAAWLQWTRGEDRVSTILAAPVRFIDLCGREGGEGELCTALTKMQKTRAQEKENVLLVKDEIIIEPLHSWASASVQLVTFWAASLQAEAAQHQAGASSQIMDAFKLLSVNCTGNIDYWHDLLKWRDGSLRR